MTLRSNRAIELDVQVPADAIVFVNDKPTTSNGANRRYTSRDLETGRNYTYAVRAEFQHNGQKVALTKSATVQVGDIARLSFDPNEPVTTALTLRVPADAKVFLSGKETSLSGDVRTFSTTKLTAGQEWADYLVRVEVQRDGRTLAKEETLTLRSGEQRELTIDPQVAAVARADK